MVMRGVVTVYLENREVECRRGDVFIIPPYVVHSVRQGKDARLLSMCIGTAFIKETEIEKAEGIIRELLRSAMNQDFLEGSRWKSCWLPCGQFTASGIMSGKRWTQA
ncbi:MAG: AraC family ligand binding domain-containing protein [Clostridium sp.]|nr:AraC family ligand binding domain-containing protein [Clostridium sp.]